MTNEILHSILDLRTKRELGALCTIVKTEVSTPLKAGAQMLVRANAAIVGTIGGGALEYSVIEQARAAMSSNESRLVQHRLTHDHKMCCGGTVHLYIEVIEVPAQCFIFGAGHVGRALATLCSSLDFEVLSSTNVLRSLMGGVTQIRTATNKFDLFLKRQRGCSLR